MAARAQLISPLFEHAFPLGMQRQLGLIRPGNPRVVRRALLVVLVGWLPIVLLTLGQGAINGGNGASSLLRESGVHARYLIAAPLLIIADRHCATFLTASVHCFLGAGIIPDQKTNEFERAVNSTRELLNSPAAEVVSFVLAYSATALSTSAHTYEQLPQWALSTGVMPGYSAAGWWHILVSLPLLLILICGWLWRLALWTRLLWIVSRFDLRLIPSHPDHVAGLGFIGHSLRAFSLVALALATIAAGRSAHYVLLGETLPTFNIWFNVGFLGCLLALFTAPLFVFSPILIVTWQRGANDYGALALRIGRTFERKWLAGSDVNNSTLGRPDFSATTDFYSVASNVYAMRFVPVDLKDILFLAIALLLPFAPVALLAVPTDTILQSLGRLLF
jgi:hypothetical protein